MGSYLNSLVFLILFGAKLAVGVDRLELFSDVSVVQRYPVVEVPELIPDGLIVTQDLQVEVQVPTLAGRGLLLVTNLRTRQVSIINEAKQVGITIDVDDNLIFLSHAGLNVGIIINVAEGVIYPVKGVDVKVWWTSGNRLNTIQVVRERRIVRLYEINQHVPTSVLTTIIDGLWLNNQLSVNKILNEQVPSLLNSFKILLNFVKFDVKIQLKRGLLLLNNRLGAIIRMFKRLPGGINTLLRANPSLDLDKMLGNRTGVQVFAYLLASIAAINVSFVNSILTDTGTIIIDIGGLGGNVVDSTIDGLFGLLKDIQLVLRNKLSSERFVTHLVAYMNIPAFNINFQVALQPLTQLRSNLRIDWRVLDNLIKSIFTDRYEIGNGKVITNLLRDLRIEDPTRRLVQALINLDDVISVKISVGFVLTIISMTQCVEELAPVIVVETFSDDLKVGYVEAQIGYAIDTSQFITVTLS